jgi:multicomponent K+:H+ antiporter subunit F
LLPVWPLTASRWVRGRKTGCFLFEAALVIAVGGFVGTVSLAKFLLRGEVIE